MTKKILIGSIGIIFLLVFVSFTSVVGAQTIKINEKRTTLIQYIRDKIKHNDWAQGGIIDTIAFMIFAFLVMMSAFLKGYLFY
ncbi:MAG: hypothetical protein NT038_04765 [Euryarchaeota archaeon]|nr:hypothetical protein [Euryarchaeota archaeon]